MAAVGWFFGATINNQLEELSDKIPEGLQWLTNQIEARPYTRDLLSKLEINDLSGTTGWIAKTLTPILRSFLGAAGSLVVMAIVSIYLAAQPERYRSGALRLLPFSARSKASELLDATGNILGRWLAGQVAVMATVGLLSGVGLWLLGIDAAFVLGLVGGLMSFVPYLGSVMTAVLATLFALAQGPYHAAAVIVMYICVHFVEGNFITPLIQAEGDLAAASNHAASRHILRDIIWSIRRLPCGATDFVRHYGARRSLHQAYGQAGNLRPMKTLWGN